MIGRTDSSVTALAAVFDLAAVKLVFGSRREVKALVRVVRCVVEMEVAGVVSE